METARTFHALVGGLEYSMFIVTACAGGEPLGFTYRRGHDAELLTVHCVPAHGTEPAEPFGGEAADEVDKFTRCAGHEGPGGVPLLDECPNRCVGRVLWRHEAGDHDALRLEPVAAEEGSAEQVFTFHRAKRIEPGQEA